MRIIMLLGIIIFVIVAIGTIIMGVREDKDGGTK